MLARPAADGNPASASFFRGLVLGGGAGGRQSGRKTLSSLDRPGPEHRPPSGGAGGAPGLLFAATYVLCAPGPSPAPDPAVGRERPRPPDPGAAPPPTTPPHSTPSNTPGGDTDGSSQPTPHPVFRAPPAGPTASATPLSVYYAPSPSTVREKGARQRVKERSRRRALPTGSPQMLQNGVTAAARGPRSLAEAPAPAADRPTDALPGRSAPGGLSKSATKTPIEPERARRNVDIPRLCSPPIPAVSAFVADLDTPSPRTIPPAPPAPPRTWIHPE